MHATRHARLPLTAGIAAVATVILAPAASAATIAEWTFENSPLPASGSSITGTSQGPFAADTGTGQAVGVHASSATAWTSPVGNGSSKSFSSNNWAVGDYYQFSLATTGFEEIVISWDQARSSTGPATFDLAYSLDGTNFSIALDNYEVSSASFSGATVNPAFTHSFNFSSIAAVNNAATVFFRLVADAVPGGTGGTSRIDNILVTGNVFAVPQFWDTTGATPGLGGAGTWDTTTPNFSTAEAGDVATGVFDSAKRARFGGTPGLVTIGAGGVTANAGIQFDVAGYTIGGTNALTLGTDPTVRALADATISAPIAGANGLTKTGAGSVTLSNPAANTFIGAVTIEGGTLVIARDNLLGNANNDIVLAGGTLQVTETISMAISRDLSGSGTLQIPATKTLTAQGLVSVGNLTLASGSVDHTTGGTFTITEIGATFGTLTFVDPVALNAPLGIELTTGLVLAPGLAAPINLNAEITVTGLPKFNVIDTQPGNPTPHVDLTLGAGVIGSGRIHKVGAGTLRLQGVTGNFTGDLRIGTSAVTPEPGGRVVVTSEAALGGASLQFNDGILENTMAMTSPVNVSIGAGQLGPATFRGFDFSFGGNLTLFNSGGAFLNRIKLDSNVTFAGGLDEAAGTTTGLSVEGVGTLRLNAPLNTLARPITVDGGKLVIAGSLSATAAPITVTNNGLLMAGTDTPSDLAALTITNGTLAPGVPGVDSTGIINTPSLTLGADAVLSLELQNSALGGHDRLVSAGNVTVAGDLLLSVISGATLAVNDLLFIIINGGANPVSGTFDGNPSSITANGYTFALSYAGDFGTLAFTGGNDVVLQVTAIPEPGSLALLGLAGGLLAVRRRRA